MTLITLTTDFGEQDGYVGAMKGVIKSINPHAELMDITHRIPPQNISFGALTLAASCRYFPEFAIHVAVVDPGVGTNRRAIAVRTSSGTFILPDNGLISMIARSVHIQAIYEITNRSWFRREISATFHGRDIFAPVAAHLSKGKPIYEVGDKIHDPVLWEEASPQKKGAEIRGQIIHIDHFGNLITNVLISDVPFLERATMAYQGIEIDHLSVTYADAEPGTPLALVGSSGLVEFAVNKGSAAELLKGQVGQEVVFKPKGVS